MKIQIINNSGHALPSYETLASAGMDLRAVEDVRLEPGIPGLVPTGLRVEVPPGCEAQIRMRSGLALKHALILPNSPGTIDPGYRGEVKVILINLGDAPFAIARGDRIAQLVVAPVTRVKVEEIELLDETARGANGFGSSGVR